MQTQKQLPVSEQFQMLMSQVKHKDGGFNKIAISTLEGFELIPADQLMRCEADDNYTYLYLKIKQKLLLAEP